MVENRTVGRFCKAHRATLFSEIRQQVVSHFFSHCADQRELRTESKEMQYCVVLLRMPRFAAVRQQ